MEYLIDLLVQLVAPLFGKDRLKESQSRKPQFKNVFRLLSVGFFGVGVIIFLLFILDTDVDPAGSIVCAGPFLLAGVIFLAIDISRKNKSLQINQQAGESQRRKLQFTRVLQLLGVSFLFMGLVIFFLTVTNKNVDPSGSIVCAGPFILVGTAFIVIDILRKNNPWK